MQLLVADIAQIVEHLHGKKKVISASLIVGSGMIEQYTTIVLGFIVTLGWVGVFLASIAEEVIAPIPSLLVQLGAGFVLMGGALISGTSLIKLFFLVALPAGVGVTLGSLVYFALGYYGGKPFIERYGKYFALPWSEVEAFQEKYTKTKADEIVVFIARALPFIPSVVSSVAIGIMRYPFSRYIGISLVASTLRAYIIGFTGWQIGVAYSDLAGRLGMFDTPALIVICLIILYILRNKILYFLQFVWSKIQTILKK